MNWEEAFRARLSALTELASAKVSWFERPRVGAMPHVLLTHVFPGVTWTHDGADGLERPRVQVDVFFTRELNADGRAIARAIRAEMERLDAVTIDGVTFLPPALLEIQRWNAETIDGGVTVLTATQDFSFFVQPEE